MIKNQNRGHHKKVGMMLIMKTCSLFYRTATIYCSIFTSLRLNVGNYQKNFVDQEKKQDTLSGASKVM